MKKTDLIHKLKQLEGISDEERAYLINLVNTKKKYGLVWDDKPEDVEEQLRENLPVLKEVKERAIINGEENPNHILIEGDNLHTLTALTFTHEGKIDVIYIDPPYNTGNKSWRYNNDYVEKEDPFRHSKWLSMMEKRLKIAKRLLKTDGAIIVAIDDYELNTLGLLLNEIFYNYERDLLIVEHHPQGAGSNTVSRTHEYAYILTPMGVGFKGRKSRDEDNKWSLKRSGQGENNWRVNRPKQFFAVIVDVQNSKVVDVGPELSRDDNYPTEKTKEGYNRIYPIDRDGKDRCWRYNRASMKKLIEQGKIEYTPKGSLVVKKHSVNAVPVFSIWKDKRYNAGTSGSVLLTDIMGKANLFPYPKSLYTVYDMLELIVGNDTSAVVLDFFAGSGTTLHAIMQMNEDDDGNRKVILATNNENNICEEVTYERNKRVIEGYTNSKGEKVDGLVNNNLRYYKSEFVGREPSIKNKKEITRLATELLCIKEDIYNEQKQIGVYQLNATYVRCFQQGQLYLLVIYDEDVIEQMVEVIQSVVTADTDRNIRFKVYVFSNGQYPYTEEFEEVLPYITLCALPDAIYKAYQNVLPKRQRQQVPELEEPTAEDIETSLQDEANPNLFNQTR